LNQGPCAVVDQPDERKPLTRLFAPRFHGALAYSEFGLRGVKLDDRPHDGSRATVADLKGVARSSTPSWRHDVHLDVLRLAGPDCQASLAADNGDFPSVLIRGEVSLRDRVEHVERSLTGFRSRSHASQRGDSETPGLGEREDAETPGVEPVEDSMPKVVLTVDPREKQRGHDIRVNRRADLVVDLGIRDEWKRDLQVEAKRRDRDGMS
jgi:hypothetical protein